MTKYRWQATAFVLVSFMLGCNEFIVVGVLSDIASSLKVTVATVGLLVTLFATVFAISTPIITILTSRFNRYRVFMTLMVIFLVGNTWSGFATSFTMLLISRMITAVVAGSLESLVIAFANDVAPRGKRAVLISWISAGFSIASVIGVPVGTAISTATSWHDAFHLISLLSLLTCLILAWLLPKHVQQVPGTIKEQLVLLTDARIYWGVTLITLSAGTLYAYYTYIRPLLTTAMGFNTQVLNWLLFALGIMSIFGNRLSGTLADNNGLKWMPHIYLVTLVLLLLMPLTLSQAVIGFGIFLALTLLLTLLGSPLQILFLDVAEADYPQAKVLASSLNAIFYNVGISLGSAAGSLTLARSSLQHLGPTAAIFAGASMLVALVLNHAIAKRRK
ncbi:MFS transporter [Levilactobacillus yonginensis]|uniref:MFS transporter n=1 Tax=Levilactobacillus yonginensis TaxID=1054041 RepID=UPI00345C8E9B